MTLAGDPADRPLLTYPSCFYDRAGRCGESARPSIKYSLTLVLLEANHPGVNNAMTLGTILPQVFIYKKH